MKIMVLGATGMLGSAMLRVLSTNSSFAVYGTSRSTSKPLEDLAPNAKIIYGVQADQPDSLLSTVTRLRPDVLINCIGLVKQLAEASDPLEAIPINSILPHRLARLCELSNTRLIHVSTDCVFSGKKGNYLEEDMPDALDLYGRSKLLGEVHYPHTITLRTSIIGHEIGRNRGLIGWFLSQQGTVKGYSRAIFSGLPTCELARVVMNFVIPNRHLHGLFHVASEPISKFDLLQLVNVEYKARLKIETDPDVNINRSLDAKKFRAACGYVSPGWPALVRQMHEFQ